MSEVKRYKVASLTNHAGTIIKHWPPVNMVYEYDFDAAQSKLSALREELAKANSLHTALVRGGKLVADRLTAAEQRNAAIVGKVTHCKECGSDDLFWFAHNSSTNGIQHNRMNTNDVTCLLVLGCNHCSETLATVSADKIAERMTAALKPTESGASE